MRNTLNKGIVLAFATALISGFAVFFNKFALSFWSNSSVFTTAKNLIAVFFLVSLLLIFKKQKELKTLSKKQWVRLAVIGLIGGSIPFLLFFKGLSLTSATNAAFIHKTLFVWVALLAIPILKEKITGLQFLGLPVLFAGVYLFSSPAEFTMGYGEILVLAATLLWAAENIIAKIALKEISSMTVAWGRMFFGSLFLLGFLSATGNVSELFAFSSAGLGWLILSGFVLFGYVISWYSALKYAPVTVVSSVLVLAAPITAILNSVFITHQFNSGLILPIILILLGSLVVSNLIKNSKLINLFKIIPILPNKKI